VVSCLLRCSSFGVQVPATINTCRDFYVSMLWSIDPGITIRRSIALLMTTLFGLVLAARYDWNGIVQRLAMVFGALALFSLLHGFIDPYRAIHNEIHIGAWRGPWSEKNYFGSQMTRGQGCSALDTLFSQPQKRLYWHA